MQKILCVDDESEILEIIKFDLEMSGFEVLTAQSVDAALALCLTEKFDYILSDVKMPIKDGKFLAQEVRRNKISCGMAFLSGFSDVDAEFMREFQIDCIFAKPYQPEIVIKYIADKLSQHR